MKKTNWAIHATFSPNRKCADLRRGVRRGADPDVRAEALLGLDGLLHQPLPGLQLRVELGHGVLALLLCSGGRPEGELMMR